LVPIAVAAETAASAEPAMTVRLLTPVMSAAGSPRR
jgi:hypothetical protein